jgi:hypothetical protein
VRAAADAITLLSDSLNKTVQTTDQFISGFRRDPNAPRRSDRRPFEINDYRATAESTTETVRELNELTASLKELLGSPDWDARTEQIRLAAAEGEAGAERLIDRLFLRSLIVVVTFVVTLLIALVLYRLVITRLAGSASNRAA